MPLNESLVNVDASHYSGGMFSSTLDPRTVNVNAMPEPLSNIQGAASYIPCQSGGRKINRRKINKISRKYKMKGSKKTIKKRIRKMKKRCRSRYARRMSRRTRHSRRNMKGGNPMSIPNYPLGHSQFLSNNGGLSNTYSIGSSLSAGQNALANPPPFLKLGPNGIDNYNHNTLNAYGNTVGSGFPSRGWF